MEHQDSHEHSHEHTHDHNHNGEEDCSHCNEKLTTAEDVKDLPVPVWKQKALETQTDSSIAPFGGSWNVESTASVGTSEKGDKNSHDHGHGHSHEHMDHPGVYSQRNQSSFGKRDFDSERAFTVGIGGPVGSGKTALMLALCKSLRDKISIAAVTNDIFTREDGEFLIRNEALPKERIAAVETGGCPHAAIREDISANLYACEQLTAIHSPLNIIFLESGGDNLAANFSNELADFTIYVIDVAGGDKVPRKGGPGVTQSDVLVINKTDLAHAVGADLDVMKRDSKRMRGDGPTVFAQVKEGLSGQGLQEIIDNVLKAWKETTA